MDMYSAATLTLGESLCPTYSRPHLYKWKTYGFLVAIILGIGLLAGGATGISGYCQVGSLSQMAQIDAIIMMAAGVVGIPLVIIGALCFARNCKAIPHQPQRTAGSKPTESVENEPKCGSSNSQTNHTPIEAQRPVHEFSNPTSCASQVSTDLVSNPSIKDELIYGPEDLKFLNVKVLDKVPRPPEVPWDDNDPHFHEPFRKNYVLLYIPEKFCNDIQYFQMPERWQHCSKNSGEDMTLGKFRSRAEINNYHESYKVAFPNFASKQFRDTMQPGWSLISTKLVPGTVGQDFISLHNLIEAQKGFEMPTVFEAFALNVMVYARTKKMPYGPEIFTYCKDQSEPHLVGFDYVHSARPGDVPSVLWLNIDTKKHHPTHCQDGAAVVLRDCEHWKASKADATKK